MPAPLKPVPFTSFAGIRNTLPAERLHVMPTKDDGTTDLVEAVNVDIDNSGGVARRAGPVMANAGACSSIWADETEAACLFVRGSKLYQLAADYTAQAMASVTAGARLAAQRVNERIYWTNGAESGVVQDGRSRSWGMDIPAAPGLSGIGGTLAPGQYQALVTFVRSDSQESGAGLPSLYQLTADGGLRVTWAPPADPDITRARVYASAPDGTVLFLAAEVVVAAGSVDVTSAAQALPLNTQWQDKPPAGQCLAYANGRIYIASGAFIFATTALGFEYVDLRDYLSLDGSRVRLLAGVDGGLFAGTDKAAYFLSGRTLDEMTRRIVSTKGAAEGSVVYVDGQKATGEKELAGMRCVLFTTGEGVFLGLPDGSVRNLTQERYRFDAAAAGAAGFIESDTLNHYLLFLS